LKEATEKDYEALIGFWNENSGWDIISREIWDKRFIQAPHGSSVVLFVEQSNKILAMLIFIRCKISMGSKLVDGCRPFASILSQSVRGRMSVIKYMVQLINFGFKTMQKKGTDIVLMLPDPRWKPLLKFIDINVGEFPLYKKDFSIDFDVSCNSVKVIDFDFNQISELWNVIKRKNIYMVLRDPENLKWKNSHRDYKIIGVFKKEKLIGIATYLEKIENKQVQICDVLIPNDTEQEFVFNEISCFINREYRNRTDYKKQVILAPKLFLKSLTKSGFVLDDYQFVFAFKRLNKEISKKALSISNWYLSAND
ncbi:MAG: hypothetical protein HOM80_16900, partial [Bacteroidetes bacterium]|nr:hypothetical protein [Bacteroidota bacterium]